ncbi:TonB-dependent receptor [Thalassotalea psychrophila]|uniref:TonB-dependent receptor n=1 Tax=Thalassotalea psychrophila TaxID=3065647 RepID=A0ABY9TXX1_9GAMM|nr:TonB-dependent receptor [Colwelliaceae bacterium SQ149]
MRYICCLFAYAFIGCCIANEVESTNKIETIEVISPRDMFSYSNKSHTSINDIEKSLLASQYYGIADWLAELPGVSYSGQGGLFQSYNIRGFSRSRVRTEVDGIPIFTDRRAGNSISFIAPELLSNANIIKGPSSSLYGSQALGGVVNLSSEFAQGTEINLGYKTPNDGMNFSYKNKTDNISSAFAYRKANNHHAANNAPLNTEFEQVSGLLRYQGAIGDITTNVSWMPSIGSDIGKSNISYPDQETATYPTEKHSLAQIQLKSSDSWLAKFYHHYQNWDTKIDRANSYNNVTSYQSHTLGTLALLTHNFMADGGRIGFEWVARKGVKINDQLELDSNNEKFANTIVNGEQDNLAVFADNNWKIANSLINFGLRYDWITQSNQGFASVQNEKLNASMSISSEWNDTIQTTVELATGFRFPTLSELYFTGETPRGRTQGNEDLTPEKSVGAQLGTSVLLTSQLTLEFSSYYYQLDDYIERYNVNELLTSYRNIERATIFGFETQIKWQQNDYVDHSLSYQQQKGETQSNQTLADLIPIQLRLNTRLDFNNFSVFNQLIFQPSLDEVSPDELPRGSYVLWNIGGDYQVTNQQTLTISINNLSDEKYHANADDKAPLQPERNITLSTKWRF